MADDQQLPPDFFSGYTYLGKPTRITLTGTEPGATLSAGGVPAGPATTPSGAPAATTGARTGQTVNPSALQLLSEIAAGGQHASQITNALKGLLGGKEAVIPGSGGFLAGSASATQPALAAGAATPAVEPVAGVTGNLATLPGESGAAAAGTASEAAQAAPSAAGDAVGVALPALAAAGGIYGAVTANQDYQKGLDAAAAAAALSSFATGPVGLVVAAVLEAASFIGGLIDSGGPSKDWTSFPNRVYADRATQLSGLQTLANQVQQAATPEDIQSAVSAYNAAQRQWDTQIPIDQGQAPYQLASPMDIPEGAKIHGATTPGTAGHLGQATNQVLQLIQAKLAELNAPTAVPPAAASSPLFGSGEALQRLMGAAA
jgi:hypothetical protein